MAAIMSLGVGAQDAPTSAEGACEPPDLTSALPADVGGVTFVGTYQGDALLDPTDRALLHSWSVDTVYAGLPISLEPDQRYLFSTASIVSPSASNSLAWRIKRDGTVAFSPFGDTDSRDYPEEVRGLDAMEAVAETLGLVDKLGELPKRDGDRTPG